MKRRLSPLLAAAAVAIAVAATAVAGASAAKLAASHWSRISGPTGAGPQLGLARTPDGTLHVASSQGGPGGAAGTIVITPVSPGGRVLDPVTVARGWAGANGLALLRMPDGTLRLFATGGHAPGLPPAQVGVNTISGNASGTEWTLDAGLVWGGAPAGASPYVSATLTKDGQPVTGWAAAGVGNVKVGLDPAVAPVQVCVCFANNGTVVTDGATGDVVLGGITIGNPAGTYLQQALPGIGPRQVFPSSTQDRAAGIAARIGAPGVYAAYVDGTTVRLSRYGGSTTTVASGPYATAKVFSGPAGRLWVAWGDDRDGLFVTRSNKAVTRFEPVQHVGEPAGTSTLWNAQGEGSAGPLDLFADVSTGASARGFWHAHVLAKPTLGARVAHGRGRSTIALTLTDAGDPLAGALILIARGGHVLQRATTNAAGKATVTVRGGGRVTITGNVPGYTTALVGLLLPAH